LNCEPLPEQLYRVKLLRRVRLRGVLFIPGQVLTVEGPDALRAAAGLVSTAQAKPADAHTERDIGLFVALRSATPS
jgi:hypothetical protein